MNTFLTVIGIVFALYGTLCIFRRPRADALILGGGVIDIAMVLCALATKTAAASISLWLILLFTLPARLLAWIALKALSVKTTNGEQGALEGIGKQSPFLSVIFCFALASAMDVTPFLHPDGKHFAIFAIAQSNLFLGILTAIPYTVMLWLTAKIITEILFTENANDASAPICLPAGYKPAIITLTAAVIGVGIFRNGIVSQVIAFGGYSVGDLPNLAFHHMPIPLSVMYIGTLILLAAALCFRRIKGNIYGFITSALCAAAFCLVLMSDIAPLWRLFALIGTGIGALVAVYSVGYVHDDNRKPAYFVLLAMTFTGVLGVALSDNAGPLIGFWELMSWASFILITWDKTEKARKAAVLYLVICGAGVYVYMPALFSITDLRLSLTSAPALLSGNMLGLSAAIFAATVGFAAKAGLVPLHVWLPAAHPEAPSAISAPLSGVLTKTGIFGIIALFWAVLGSDCLYSFGSGPSGLSLPGTGLILAGVITMFYGEIFALKQTDIKRMLAYSTIGQIGEIVAVLGIGTWLALTGSLTHVLNHAIMKDLLFLAAGALIMRTGSRKLGDMAGIGRYMPWTAGCMTVGLVAVMGLPPFNGFIGKYLMILACIDAGHIGLAAALLIAALIGSLYYIRAAQVIVLDEPSDSLKARMASLPQCEVPWSMRIPMFILAGLCILLGVIPQLGPQLASSVADALASVNHLNADTLPDISVEWPLYVCLPMFGAIIPLLLRRSDRLCAYASAILLLLSTLLVISETAELDMLSYAMALAVPFMGAINMFYARGYMEHSHTRWRFYVVFLMMTGGLLGVATSKGLFAFFTFWEIMSSWTLYFAIAHEGTPAATREAGKYFLFNIAGAAFLFIGVAIFGSIGHATDFESARKALAVMSPAWGTAALILFAVGFTMKAAQMSVRIDWQMHPNFAPTPVSGYISSVLLKIAVFALVKLFFELFGYGIDTTELFHRRFIMDCVAWIGGFTLIYAALRAMTQDRVKMVFIWSTVSQIGYMILGVSVGTALGVAGGLLQAANHMLFKDLLFLVAGSIKFATHREFLRDISGIGRAMPVTMGCFALGALAAAGVPPTNGFTSKWIIYQALMQEGRIALAFLALFGSAITLAYLVRFFLIVFFGRPAKHAEHIREVCLPMRIPMYLLAALTVITGIFPRLFMYPINTILTELRLDPLNISLFGIDSGAGAWNAGTVSLLTMIAFTVVGGITYILVRRLPKRIVEPHACGLDAQQAFSPIPPDGTYQAWTQLFEVNERKNNNSDTAADRI